MVYLNEELKKIFEKAITNLFGVENAQDYVVIEIPKDKNHGDYATSVAMRLTKLLRCKPQEIAEKIKEEVLKEDLIESIEIAGPGFINVTVKKESLSGIIHDVLVKKEQFANTNYGKNQKIMVEYVSANPTGDLHLGHARGAAYGDTLTRVLNYIGYDVCREYYVNDAGNQIEVLGASLYERYLEALGLPIDLDKIGYQGKDVKKLAASIAKKDGNKWVNDNSEERFAYFKQVGTKLELDKIKVDLDLYRVGFDHYQSELELYKSNKVQNALEALKKTPYAYEHEGALWLRTTEFGDDKDRVLIKSDGSLTYFTPDIAYHKDKFDRGFSYLVDVLGADHHGYIARLKAGLKIMGYNPDNLEIKICQIVRLMDNGIEVKMSKRTGNAVTIRELCEDVGVDVARYFFISKPLISHLDFDLGLARKQSSENPVYYIQYAYARMNSILKKNSDFEIKDTYPLLTAPKEVELMKHMGELKDVLVDVANVKEVNIVCNYAYKFAQIFHSYYVETQVLDENNLEITKERLAFIKACSIVLKTVMNLLGVDAKEEMYNEK